MELTDVGQTRTLWIDQICILQRRDSDDFVNEEKPKQLKLMDEIYKKAHDVLVWLGDPPPNIPNATAYVEQLPSVIETIQRNVARIGPNFLPNVSAGLPLNDDPVWEIIVDFLHKDWHYRVWTLQEAVLAKELVVYYGANILDWDLVVKLYGVYGSAPFMPLRDIHDQKELNYKSIASIQTYRKQWKKLDPGVGIDWAHLLWTCGYRKCTDPLDRIYALLGMAGDSVKEVIEPNYKIDERQLFLAAFRFAIDCDRQLHILSLPFERGDSENLPTWCPNLKKPFKDCFGLNSYYAGTRKKELKDEKSSTVYRDPDSDHLKIQGLKMDTISQIANSNYPGFEERFTVKRQNLISEFREETLKMAESLYDKPYKALEPYCRTLIADVPGTYNGRKWSTEDMITGYNCHFTTLPEHALLSAREKSLSSKYGSLVNKACIGRKFILTAEGRVGLVPAKSQVGDVICIFLGAGAAHVLRPNNDADKTFQLVGDCYLHGIMNMEALDMLEEGKVEQRDFTIT